MSESKTALLISILLFIPVSIPAATLSGKVISSNGYPIAGASIQEIESGIRVLTDEWGCFVIELTESDRVQLRINHSGHMEKILVLHPRDFQNEILVELLPYIRKKEEILVTASRYPEAVHSIPAAENVVSRETLDADLTPNITEGVNDFPGVSKIGAGGFSFVPSIRGLARRRVLVLVDSARITSDRRTGPNASFVSARDIDKIEILRSPSSVFYGSDAMGGVIHIITKNPSMREGFHGSLFSKYGTANQEKSLGFSLEGVRGHSGGYLSLQTVDAENYSSPRGEIPMSQFGQGSVLGKLYHGDQRREISFSFLGARGTNIGKANRDSREKPTWYPHEKQNLLQFQWKEKQLGSRGSLDTGIFLNPNMLETVKEHINGYKAGESISRIRSLDYGIHMIYGKEISPDWRCRAGWEMAGRSGADSINQDTSFNESGEIIEQYLERPYHNGRRLDSGIFAAADFTGWTRMNVSGGFRWDSIKLEAVPGDCPGPDRSRYQALTGFLGASVEASPSLIVFGNVGRAYRVPSISELFYTGVTGRGFITANPDLKPETSMNLDIGLKIFRNRYFFGLYAFHYRVNHLIERYQSMDDLYHYGNVDNGCIQGLEMEWECTPVPGWLVFGNVFVFDGASVDTGIPLNDIPAPRMIVGTKFWIQRFSIEIRGWIQRPKNDPGPAEVEVAGYERLDLKTGCVLGASLRVYLIVSNALNRIYTAGPDPLAVEAPGRSLMLGLSYGF